MNEDNKLTKETLIQQYLEAEKREGKILPSTDLTKFGLQPVSKYNQKFGNWTKFLSHIGRDVKERKYTRKSDYNRFFYPKEYIKFMEVIKNEKHRAMVTTMLNSGMKISEARLKDSSFPSTQYFDKMMKLYARRAGIEDWNNFSAQTLCKTFEVWAMSGLEIKKSIVQQIVGRIIRKNNTVFNEEDKELIKRTLVIRNEI